MQSARQNKLDKQFIIANNHPLFNWLVAVPNDDDIVNPKFRHPAVGCPAKFYEHILRGILYGMSSEIVNFKMCFRQTPVVTIHHSCCEKDILGARRDVLRAIDL